MDLHLSTHLLTMLQTTAIKAMLDYIPNQTVYKAIMVGKAVPASWQELNKMLQIYRVSTIGSSALNTVTYTINCRQATEANSDILAGLVYNEINRTIKTYLDKDVYTKCSIGVSIFEKENFWNVPVDIKIYSER